MLLQSQLHLHPVCTGPPVLGSHFLPSAAHGLQLETLPVTVHNLISSPISPPFFVFGVLFVRHRSAESGVELKVLLFINSFIPYIRREDESAPQRVERHDRSLFLAPLSIEDHAREKCNPQILFFPKHRPTKQGKAKSWRCYASG